MKLSTRARYGLRMMVEIARHAQDGDTVSLADVADRTDISRRYLDQLAVGLKNSRLIRGIAGKGGGYILVDRAEQINIGQIIEATIGSINIVECVGRPETCAKADSCECRVLYKAINDRITDVLNDISLAELAFGRLAGGDLASIPLATTGVSCPPSADGQTEESSDEQGKKSGQHRDPCCRR
jgi:Rrf2 family protein